MSFSRSVKMEMIEVKFRHDIDKLELISGYTLAIASLKYVSKAKRWGLRYVSECAPAVSFIAKLIGRSYNVEHEIAVTVHQRLKAHNTKLLVYGEELDKLIEKAYKQTEDDVQAHFFVGKVRAFWKWYYANAKKPKVGF